MIYLCSMAGALVLCILGFILQHHTRLVRTRLQKFLHYLGIGGIIIGVAGAIITPIALMIHISPHGRQPGFGQEIYVGLGCGRSSYGWNMTKEEFEKRVSYTDKNEIRIKDGNREFVSSSYYIIKYD